MNNNSQSRRNSGMIWHMRRQCIPGSFSPPTQKSLGTKLLAVQLRQHIHCSPIGFVPKDHNTRKWHMIVDLSNPGGQSVNNGIPKPFCSLRYPFIADAIQFIRMLGPGTLLLKVDLKSAYCIVPVNSFDRHLLGLCWEDHAYVDQALPFGLRSAPHCWRTQ